MGSTARDRQLVPLPTMRCRGKHHPASNPSTAHDRLTVVLTAAAAAACVFSRLFSCRFQKMCMEPTSFTVKEDSQFKGGDTDFVKTKLMTRLTYTLDEVRVVYRVVYRVLLLLPGWQGVKGGRVWVVAGSGPDGFD